MLVFGDRAWTGDPRPRIAALTHALSDLAHRPAGLARHAALVGAFVDASELAQGLADAALAARGLDARDLAADAVMAILVELARAIEASWRSPLAPLPALALPGALLAARLPEAVTCKRAEGHAFYAVYPECYLAAARSAPPGPRRVIGVRSIGVGLAALVAAVHDAPLPASVRPLGEPFRRHLSVSPELVAEWLGDPRATIAIADEGPGASGSSFGAVADLLEDRGARVEIYPSHARDLGPEASARHRARWRHVPRHVTTADQVIVPALAGWLEELVGPLVAPLEDLSAGAWRTHRFASQADWPPVVACQERKKLLARTRTGTWLARFAGLGAAGERALVRARALHAAGFAPEPVGLCHGFLVERWLAEAATPLDLARDRPRIVDHVGHYLAFRARAFPAARDRGASLDELLRMARRNTALALGEAAAGALDRHAAALAARARPIEIDGRLHPWEWLVLPGGAIVKTDALDHHDAHDLIGCQDLAWDLAGAAVELGLAPADQARLAAIAGAPDPRLQAALRACYLAFQLGRCTLGAGADAAPAEAARLRAAAERYATVLAAELA